MFEAIKTDYLTMAGSPRMNPRAVSAKIVSEFHVACHREIDSNANIIRTVDDPFSSSPLVFLLAQLLAVNRLSTTLKPPPWLSWH